MAPRNGSKEGRIWMWKREMAKEIYESGWNKGTMMKPRRPED